MNKMMDHNAEILVFTSVIYESIGCHIKEYCSLLIE